VVKAGALLLGIVAVAATAVAWLQRPDHITAAEAVRAAASAFDAAGLSDASIELRAVAGRYDADDQPEVAVWKTTAKLDDGTVELWLSRRDGEAVFLDDRTPDGAGQLLTDAQFRALGDHYDNPALGRQVRRNLLVTLAAALVLVGCLLLAQVDPRPAHAARRSSSRQELR
jgi:hypothetical protein